MNNSLSMTILFTILFVVLSFGCSRNGKTGKSVTETGGDGAANAISTATTVEVACATCIYKMDGVKGCTLAAKIDGTPVLVTGGEVNAHEDGLCAGAKQAVVEGKLEGNVFIATKVELK